VSGGRPGFCPGPRRAGAGRGATPGTPKPAATEARVRTRFGPRSVIALAGAVEPGSAPVIARAVAYTSRTARVSGISVSRTKPSAISRKRPQKGVTPPCGRVGPSAG
jgi:hypothetical protein